MGIDRPAVDFARGALRVFLLLLIFKTCLPSLYAQQTSAPAPEARPIVVSVTDGHGNAITDLTRENFRLSVNGKPVPLLNAIQGTAPARLVVLLDMSGSMTTEDKWRIATAAATDLLTEIPEDIPIEMLTFSGTTLNTFDSSHKTRELAEWLKEVSAHPPRPFQARTALFDALQGALKLLNPPKPGDAIYIISDGRDNASQASGEQMKKVLLNSRVRLFCLLFNDTHSGLPERDSWHVLREMAEDSGGEVFDLMPSAPGVYTYESGLRSTVKSHTKELGSQLKGYWLLEFAPTQSSNGSKVRVRVSTAGKQAVVSYPRQLAAQK